ncbi:hypothetical protein [Staphylococcus hominis]|uniref:hypothetical protein n=1 Tax=Staphylococcus hominis TaxID=1290 RepID=UPI0034CDBA79
MRRFKIDLYNYVRAEREKRQEEHNKKSFNAYLVDKDEVRKRQQKKKINNGYGLTLNQEKELRLIKEHEEERNTDMGVFIDSIQQMNNDEMNKLSEALELSESQRLALYNYSEREAKEKEHSQEQKKELSSLEKHEKRQQIMSIKDANQRQEEIAKHVELFK